MKDPMFGLIVQAAGMFAVTNIDDLLLLALYFGRAGGDRASELRVVAGQFLGFGGILAISLLAAFGLSLLSEDLVAYLGLLPIALGVRAGMKAWQHRRAASDDNAPPGVKPAGTVEVASVTFANGGDNIGVYVPVFASVGAAGTAGYVVVFLVLVAVWCAAGRFFATRAAVARLLARWGDIVLPVVLIAIGLVILHEGGAFGW